MLRRGYATVALALLVSVSVSTTAAFTNNGARNKTKQCDLLEYWIFQRFARFWWLQFVRRLLIFAGNITNV